MTWLHACAVRALVACLAMLWVVASAGEARAYEGKLLAGAGLGYAHITGDTPIARPGLLSALHLEVGLDDTWSLRLIGQHGWHPSSDGAHIGSVGTDVVYALDVLRWVPYLGLGTDLFVVGAHGGGNTPSLDWAVHGVVGLDYLVNFDWLVGVEFRPYVCPLSLGGDGEVPMYMTVSMHVKVGFDVLH